jgi:DNA-binding transcriptional regulator of glucitol operon
MDKQTIKNKGDTIVILQERMAGWLQFNRFHKIDERPDLKNPMRNVFVFKNTPDLQRCIDRYEHYKNIINE